MNNYQKWLVNNTYYAEVTELSEQGYNHAIISSKIENTNGVIKVKKIGDNGSSKYYILIMPGLFYSSVEINEKVIEANFKIYNQNVFAIEMDYNNKISSIVLNPINEIEDKIVVKIEYLE